MKFETLDVRVEDKIGRISLSRPDKANAMNGKMWQELREAFHWAHEQSDIRVVILNGQGPHFSAGIDFGLIMEIVGRIQPKPEGHKQEALHRIILDLQDCLSAAEQCAKPIIASVHGNCLGGGVGLIACCDIRISSSDAQFSVKEIDLGIVADIGTLQRLPHFVSHGVLKEWAFTGRKFSADEALRAGLLNRVVDRDELDAQTIELAHSIAAKSPLTIRGIKRIINKSRDLSVADGLDLVAAWNASMLLSQDAQKAATATMMKSKPDFID